MKTLTIDTTEFEKIGMTILKTKPVRDYSNVPSMAFPTFDKPFNPKGITLEEAIAAMKKCHE